VAINEDKMLHRMSMQQRRSKGKKAAPHPPSSCLTFNTH